MKILKSLIRFSLASLLLLEACIYSRHSILFEKIIIKDSILQEDLQDKKSLFQVTIKDGQTDTLLQNIVIILKNPANSLYFQTKEYKVENGVLNTKITSGEYEIIVRSNHHKTLVVKSITFKDKYLVNMVLYLGHEKIN